MSQILLEYEKNNYPKLFKPILNKDGSITNKPVKSTYPDSLFLYL